jgi:hypothetical protein
MCRLELLRGMQHIVRYSRFLRAQLTTLRKSDLYSLDRPVDLTASTIQNKPCVQRGKYQISPSMFCLRLSPSSVHRVSRFYDASFYETASSAPPAGEVAESPFALPCNVNRTISPSFPSSGLNKEAPGTSSGSAFKVFTRFLASFGSGLT